MDVNRKKLEAIEKKIAQKSKIVPCPLIGQVCVAVFKNLTCRPLSAITLFIRIGR